MGRRPTPASDLVSGAWAYAATISMGGQSMDLSTTLSVVDAGSTWTVTEGASTPMGEAIDTATIEKGTLRLLKRSITQGQVSIVFEVKDGKAVGQMSTGGKAQPIDAALGGTLFADGAGANEVIARLPLADGYTASFLNFDVQTQKPTVRQLKVAGTERVTVPAGAFDCIRVEVSGDDGAQTTLWVARDTRGVVKAPTMSPRNAGRDDPRRITRGPPAMKPGSFSSKNRLRKSAGSYESQVARAFSGFLPSR